MTDTSKESAPHDAQPTPRTEMLNKLRDHTEWVMSRCSQCGQPMRPTDYVQRLLNDRNRLLAERAGIMERCAMELLAILDKQLGSAMWPRRDSIVTELLERMRTAMPQNQLSLLPAPAEAKGEVDARLAIGPEFPTVPIEKCPRCGYKQDARAQGRGEG